MKSDCSCLRNPLGPKIKSAVVEMLNILGQCKEVVEFLDTNMGRVEVILREMSENLDERWPVWGNLVEEYFNGDDVAALLVIVINLFPYPQSKTSQTIIIKFSSKVVVLLIVLLLVSLLYHYIAGKNTSHDFPV